MTTLRSQPAAAWPRWPPAGPWPAEPPWPVGRETEETDQQGESRRRRARRRPRLVLLLVVLFATVGIGVTVHALWIPAKAVLAQVLLEQAWQEVRRGAAEGSAAARPWPWADTWPVARLTLPGRAPMVVLAGASGRTLAFAPGHLDGSARPGEAGHVVLAGHRDTHFRALARLHPGDEVAVEDPAGRLRRYRVTGAAVVDHRDTSVLAAGGDRLTLVTCWPFDALHPGGPLRYVVAAEAVDAPAATSPAG